MLRSVELSRFKAAYQTPAIELKPLTVLIGRNGSGKSTMLEALQWIHTAWRHDVRKACDDYAPIEDIINLRAETRQSFRLQLTWDQEESPWAYTLKVGVVEKGIPLIEVETLTVGRTKGMKHSIMTETNPPTRRYYTSGTWVDVESPERLALSLLPRSDDGFLTDFWKNAVFLRLSPRRLVEGSYATKKSFDPVLDEEGALLPALLKELNEAQWAELVRLLNKVLPDIRGIDFLDQEAGREARINFALRELMPYRGRGGVSEFAVPSWMLSEGTRRITAIFALLVRQPPPSLLCIEEIENGLDPWTVLDVLHVIQDAVARGVQVIVTTHSPWLLDHIELDAIIHVRREQGATLYERFADRASVKAYADDVPPGTRFVNEIG